MRAAAVWADEPGEQIVGPVEAPIRRAGVRQRRGGDLDFWLFILVNAVLLVRPAEIVPGWAGLHLYEISILGALAAALPGIVRQFQMRRLLQRPITLMVLGMLVAVVLSHLVHGDMARAIGGGVEFAKVVLYYLLLLAVVDTPQRLRRFLMWVAILITVLGAVSLAQYRGLIDVAELRPILDRMTDAATGRDVGFERMIGPGIFRDPNDLGHVLAVGVILCVCQVGQRLSPWLARALWALPLVLLAYGIKATQSRGGLLALLVGLGVLFVVRFGWKRAMLLGVLLLPLMLKFVSGRQADISTSDGTGQARVQLWSDALVAFRQNPLLGLGEGKLVDFAGQVAHNSFLHCYAELGIIGGTCFLGAFYLAFMGIYGLRGRKVVILQPEMRYLWPFMAALVGAYIAGMASLSRAYVVPTYLFLGLAVVYQQLVRTAPPRPAEPVTGHLILRLLAVSVVFLVAMQIFVRVAVRWS